MLNHNALFPAPFFLEKSQPKRMFQITGILFTYDPLLTLLSEGDFVFIDVSAALVTTKEQETLYAFFVALALATGAEVL
jgi:hypothetical protein